MKKQVISISPSVLGNVQYYLESIGTPWEKDVQSLIDDLAGEFVTNEAMSRGSAYGWMLENGPEKYLGDIQRMEINGGGSTASEMWADVEITDESGYLVPEPDLGKVWEFTEEEVAPIYKYRKENPNVAYEMKARLFWEIDGETIIMDLRVDGLNLPVIDEFKTSSKKKKWKDRKDSAQWMAYLVAFPEAVGVRYHEFQFLKRGRKVVHRTSWHPRVENLKEILEGKIRQVLPFIKGNPEVLKARTRTIEIE